MEMNGKRFHGLNLLHYIQMMWRVQLHTIQSWCNLTRHHRLKPHFQGISTWVFVIRHQQQQGECQRRRLWRRLHAGHCLHREVVTLVFRAPLLWADRHRRVQSGSTCTHRSYLGYFCPAEPRGATPAYKELMDAETRKINLRRQC